MSRPGAVLGRTFAAWLEGFLTFSALSVVASLPMLAYAGWLMADEARLVDREGSWGAILTAGSWLSWSLATAAVTHAVVWRLRGRPPSFGASLRAAVLRFLPLLLTVVTLGLYLLAPLLLGIVLPALFGVVELFRSEIVGIAILGGVVVGMGVVLVAHAVSIPVAVVEGGPPQAVLARSRALTNGDRWRVLAVLLVLAVLAIGVHLLAATALPRPRSPDGLRVRMAVGLVLETLGTTPLLAIATALLYHDLRVGKEGVSTDDLARVFE